MREVHDSDLARDLPRILFDAARCEQTSILDESGKIAMVVGTGDLRIEDDGEDEPPDRESYEWVS